MKLTILGLSPNNRSIAILVFGIAFTVVTFYGLTNQFKGLTIPKAYEVLIGK